MSDFFQQPADFGGMWDQEDDPLGYFNPIEPNSYQFNQSPNLLPLQLPFFEEQKVLEPTGQSIFKTQESHSLSQNDFREYLDLKPEFATAPGLTSTPAHRPKMEIEVSESVQKRREQAMRLESSQTKNLGASLHRLTSRFVEMKVRSHQVRDTKLRQACQAFCKGKSKSECKGTSHERSLAAFYELFQHPQLRQMCLQLYSSPSVAGQLMGGTTSIGVKLTVLRYLERMRQLSLGKRFKRWKK